MIKGLIISGHILLSDKHQRGNVTKIHEGVLFHAVVFATSSGLANGAIVGGRLIDAN